MRKGLETRSYGVRNEAKHRIASEKPGREDLDQPGKVFRVAGCARLHRQMRSTENSSRTIRTNPPDGMYHFGVDAHD